MEDAICTYWQLKKRENTPTGDPVDVFLGVLCLDMKINDVNAALLNMKYAF